MTITFDTAAFAVFLFRIFVILLIFIIGIVIGYFIGKGEGERNFYRNSIRKKASDVLTTKKTRATMHTTLNNEKEM